MVCLLKTGAALSLILGVALAYPYPYHGQNYEDGELIYDERPPLYDVRYIPLRRVSRAAPPPHHLASNRGNGRDRIVLIPEGMQMQMRGDQRGDLIPMRGDQRGDLNSATSNKEPITAETGYGHSSHPYDYVDYGAYTGGYGAFGWYSDHPVTTYGGYH